jgi:copper transport protein
VVALAATGAVNGWRQLTGIDDLVDTGYGRWLTAKLAILAIVLVVAAASRHAVHGGVLGRSRTPSGRLDDPAAEAGVPQRTRMLERNVVIELAGIAVILVLTVGLTSTVPPRAIGAVTAADDATGATTSATVDGLVMELELRPARPGPNSLRVTVMSPVEPVVPDEITVTAELTSEQIGPIDLPVEPVAPGTVTSDSAILPAQGGWTFVVTARFGDFDQTVFRAELDVSD